MAQIDYSPSERRALGLLRAADVASTAPKAPDERAAWTRTRVALWRSMFGGGRPLGPDLVAAVYAHIGSEQGRFWPKPADLAAHMPSGRSELAGEPLDPELARRWWERRSCEHWQAAQAEEWRRWIAEHPDPRSPGSELRAVMAYGRSPAELDERVESNRRRRMAQAQRGAA